MLKPKCLDALKRIFKISDVDKDGLLNAHELNQFQVSDRGELGLKLTPNAAKMLLHPPPIPRARRHPRPRPLIRSRPCPARNPSVFLHPFHSLASRSFIWPITPSTYTFTLSSGRGYNRARISISAYDIRATRTDGDYLDCAEEVRVWGRAGSAGRLLATKGSHQQQAGPR
jgi:hypothetical protein